MVYKKGFFDWVEGPAYFTFLEPLDQEDIDKQQVRIKQPEIWYKTEDTNDTRERQVVHPERDGE